MTFKEFFLAEAMTQQLPELMTWVRDFFRNRMDTAVLKVYGDWLYDQGPQYEQAADLFRAVGGQFRDVRRKRGEWRGPLITPFYDVFGHNPAQHRYEVNDSMANAWLIVRREDGHHQMARHIVYENVTSYRLSLTNGQWSSYTNTQYHRVCVVSSRHQPTGDSEQYYPPVRVTPRDYQPLDVENVPDDVLLFAFARIMERQIRGGH